MAFKKRDGKESHEDFSQLLRAMDYEVQFFGLSSYFIYEKLKEYLLQRIRICTTNVEKSLLKRSDSSESHQCHEIKNNLLKKFEIVVEQCFSKMEGKFFAVFEIPPHVLLPEDKIHTKQYTKNDVEKIDDEINKLLKRYKRAVCLEALLREELRRASFLDIVQKKVMELEDNASTVTGEYEKENLVKL